MDSRGRSRQVSQTAIARKAAQTASSSSSPPSYPSSSSSSPDSSMSPDYDYDESPSPPQTLEDQVYIAYADDNMHLARILLLRLKGIEVDGDNDPRIAEVRDEDFDYCFAPHGGLTLDEESEKALLERQRLENQKMEERRRLERLWTREQKWAAEKRRMREERTRVVREQEMRRAEGEQRRRVQEQRSVRVRHQPEARLFQLRGANDRPRQIVSYTSRRCQAPNNSDTDSDDEPATSSLLSDFMIVPHSPRGLRRHQPTSPLAPSASSHRNSYTPAFDDSCSISFTEVIASMNGPLFPVTHEERRRSTQSPTANKGRSRSRSKGPGKSNSQVRRRKQSELFQSLLVAPSSTEEDWRRSRKGKAKAAVPPRASSGRCSECRRSPSSSSSVRSSPSSSASSPANSRPSSWLSFGSTATTSSISTTPPSSPSPRSGWLKSVSATIPSPTSPSRRGSWLGTTVLSPPLPIERRSSFEEKPCTCHKSHLIPIDLSESPLTFEVPLAAPILASPPKPYSTSIESIRTRKRSASLGGPGLAGALLNNVSAGVNSLMGLAKGFQQAYVAAAMFSVAAACDGDRWEEREVAYEYDKERGVRIVRVVKVAGDVYTARGVKEESKKKSAMKRVGHRVSPQDLAKFLDVKPRCSCACVSATRKASTDSADRGEVDQQKDVATLECVHRVREAKLSKYYDIPLGNPYAPAQSPPSTVLPNPLPYKIHFKPIPTTSRSPFRFNAFSHTHTTYPEQESVAENTLLSACSSGTVRGISWRIRSVNNPVFLRLRALQNIIAEKGLQWEGRGRELSMGGGRDRMVGVAYEGVGCSKLSRGPVLVGRL